MRDGDEETGALFIYLNPDALVPCDHPLLAVQSIANDSLDKLTAPFQRALFPGRRTSIARKKLLRGLSLQVFYGIRSECQLMEQLTHTVLFR